MIRSTAAAAWSTLRSAASGTPSDRATPALVVKIARAVTRPLPGRF
ncbi:hypothetical protein ACIBO5_34700 [Nonomuraea angiospora]|nr:hypothetical protein [Nonomuraea angiospora]MDX3108965.1 hypothetical protein [Nonomuraea angiospora]